MVETLIMVYIAIDGARKGLFNKDIKNVWEGVQAWICIICWGLAAIRIGGYIARAFYHMFLK